MNSFLTVRSPLQNVFWQHQNTLLKQFLFILSGAFLLAFASQLSIPLNPVPLTFQSATVILIGMAYGPRYSAYSILTYYMLGISGVPVFADFSFGIYKFFGPTGGYLISFLPAAIISGYLAEKGFAKNPVTSFIAACLGTSIIFSLGVSVLSLFVGWQQAFVLGFMPFIMTECIKLIAVSLLVPRLWKKTD